MKYLNHKNSLIYTFINKSLGETQWILYLHTYLVIYLWWSPKMDLGTNKVSKEKDIKVIILEIFITLTPIFDIISGVFCNSHSMHLHSVIMTGMIFF